MLPITTVLFDFDGVIADTEGEYDEFFDKLSDELRLGVADFAAQIKGTRLKEVLELKFPQFSETLKKRIVEKTTTFELTMDYPLVAGVMDFIHYLKSNGYKVGLVTSSHEEKMKIAMGKLSLNGVFDTEVMAGRITAGKPNPMCYLLAAKDLNVSPEACLVFEDSIAGLQSASAAGMRTVGVSTTLPKEELQKITPDVIADFADLECLKNYLV